MAATFTRTPELVGERRWPTDFTHRLTLEMPTPAGRLRMMNERRAWPPHTSEELGSLPVAKEGVLSAATNELGLTWVGHASFVVQIGGLTVLTDPVWANSFPGVTRVVEPGVAWDDLPPVDAMVLSHNHRDHLDAATVLRLPRRTWCFVPAAMARWFTRRGFVNVVELDWWESARLGDVTFEFVPAHHWSRRGAWDTNATLWGGWVLSAADRKCYFAGDSGYGDCFAEIGSRHSGLDVALLPVGSYAPAWYMQPMHMDPDEAVQAHVDLGASHMVPMHWGTFDLGGEPLLEPIERTRAAWARHGLERSRLWDLPVGGARLM